MFAPAFPRCRVSLPTCVIYNPAAGRGRAARLLRTARRLTAGVELRPTTGPGSAVELSRAACEQGFARVVAAGGDGTAHEVASGVLLSGRPDVVLSPWPLGSMNDYAFTLGLGAWWAADRDAGSLEILDADVGVVEAGDRRRFFVNGCGVGFNGLVSEEARKIRYLRGAPLYTLAVLKSLVKHFAAPLLRMTLDGETTERSTLALSFGLGQREGGFALTPLARLDDALFDYLRVGDVRRWELVRYFPGMLTGAIPVDHPKVEVGRCSSAEVYSDRPLCVHADGETVCTPADGILSARVSLLPGRLRVECYPPALYGGGRFDRLKPRLGTWQSR